MNLIRAFAGYMSGIIIFIALILYLRAILSNRVESNKTAWGIWAIVTGMLLFTYYKSVGFVSNIWVSIVYFLGVFLIFIILSLYSQKSSWTWVEKTSLIGVLIILLIWFLNKSSEIALFSTLFIDILGAIPIIVSAYKNPEGEYAPAWYLGFFGNALNLIAVENWNFVNALYPLYLALITLVVAILASFPKPVSYDSRISEF